MFLLNIFRLLTLHDFGLNLLSSQAVVLEHLNTKYDSASTWPKLVFCSIFKTKSSAGGEKQVDDMSQLA